MVSFLWDGLVDSVTGMPTRKAGAKGRGRGIRSKNMPRAMQARQKSAST